MPGRAATMFPPTLVEMRLVQATLFKNVLEAISDLFSEAHFDFSGTGFELQAMDSSTVALVALRLRAEAFNHYRCHRALSMGLDLAQIAKAFRYASNDDIATVEAVHDYFTIKFESPKNGRLIWEYDFDFVDVKAVLFELPEITAESEYQAIVRMPSALFVDICNKLSSFTDRDIVVISVYKECVEFFTLGETGNARVVCRQTQTSIDKPKEPALIEMMKEEVSMTLDLRCMNSFSKATTVSDQVTIRLSSELPAVFEYKIAEMGYIRYYLLLGTLKGR